MENTKNLYQRISAVMQDIEYLAKDDSVGSGSYAYKAISEEKVTQTVRVSLIKNGLVVLPIEQTLSLTDHVRENGKLVPITTVEVKYKIVNIDKPSEFEIIVSGGQGVDPQDKGAGKAMTYSYKYLFLRTFALPTGEDPDKIHNNDLEKQQAKVAIQAKPINDVPKQTFGPASDRQKGEINRLLLNAAFTGEARTNIQSSIATLDEDQAERLIAKMKKKIEGKGVVSAV